MARGGFARAPLQYEASKCKFKEPRPAACPIQIVCGTGGVGSRLIGSARRDGRPPSPSRPPAQSRARLGTFMPRFEAWLVPQEREYPTGRLRSVQQTVHCLHEDVEIGRLRK